MPNRVLAALVAALIRSLRMPPTIPSDLLEKFEAVSAKVDAAKEADVAKDLAVAAAQEAAHAQEQASSAAQAAHAEVTASSEQFLTAFRAYAGIT